MTQPTDEPNPYDWRCMFDRMTVIDHEWSVKTDSFGADDVINGTCTYHYLECENCGHKKQATYEDLQDDYWDEP